MLRRKKALMVNSLSNCPVDVAFTLQVLREVIIRGAKVDAVEVFRNVDRLHPIVEALVQPVKKVITLTVLQEMFRFFLQ